MLYKTDESFVQPWSILLDLLIYLHNFVEWIQNRRISKLNNPWNFLWWEMVVNWLFKKPLFEVGHLMDIWRDGQAVWNIQSKNVEGPSTSPSPRLKASVWKAVNQGPDVNPPGVGPVFRKCSKRCIPSENAWWVKGSSNEKRSLKDSRIWGNCSSLPR